MSLIYLDIDYFKTINDQYGHHEGDIVLKEIGTRLIKNTRSSDYIGRIGGEEFAVLLPNCTIEKTWQIAERLRKENSRSADLFKKWYVHSHYGINWMC
ncbi:Response regulator PleD [Bacillus safensis subsp. safensis]